MQYYWYPGARYNIDPGDDYNTLEVYFGALPAVHREVLARPD
jgi:hypothetical protein